VQHFFQTLSFIISFYHFSPTTAQILELLWQYGMSYVHTFSHSIIRLLSSLLVCTLIQWLSSIQWFSFNHSLTGSLNHFMLQWLCQ
jgi:hypothetical protein